MEPQTSQVIVLQLLQTFNAAAIYIRIEKQVRTDECMRAAIMTSINRRASVVNVLLKNAS